VVLVAVFLVYFACVGALGLIARRRNKGLDDFLLAGRRLGTFTAALSAQASDMSAWLVIGLPGAAYTMGYSAIWIVVGCVAGTAFNWFVLARRLRVQSERFAALTIPDYFESRFGGGGSHVIRLISVCIILLSYCGYISAQFIAAGKLFETVSESVPEFTVSYTAGIAIGASIVLLYTIIGGFIAVSWTDVLQGLLMLFAVTLVPLAALRSMGGLSNALDLLRSSGNPQEILSFSGGKAGTAFVFGVFLSNFSWAFGYPGQPHILARYMAIRDERKVPLAGTISVVWVVLALSGAFALGLAGRAATGASLADAEHVMPSMSYDLLPPWLCAVVCSAALAAMMSTADSQLLVGSSCIVEDLVVKTFKVRLSPARALQLSRLAVLVLTVFAMGVSLRKANVFAQVFNAWSALGAGLGPALVLSLIWKGTRKEAIAIGMVFGVLFVYFWPWAHGLLGWEHLADPLALGFIGSALLIVVGSLIFPGTSPNESEDGEVRSGG
jgi:sodium/proline symporter